MRNKIKSGTYNIMIKAKDFPRYLLSTLSNNTLNIKNWDFNAPVFECDFAVLDEEYKNANEAVDNARGWFGIRDISNVFNSSNICLLIDYFGGGCGSYVEFDELSEWWDNPTPEEVFWNAIKDTVDRGEGNLKPEDKLVVSFTNSDFIKYHYYRMLDTFFSTTEFRLIKDENGYGLVDLQGGNLGGIESYRENSLDLIIDGMDAYIADYYADAIEENWPDENEDISKYNWGTLAQLGMVRMLDPHISGDDFDILDVICNHVFDIDIQDYFKWANSRNFRKSY